MQTAEWTALELGRKIRKREITAQEAVRHSLKRIREQDGTLNCFITVDEEGALAQAEAVQKKIEDGTCSSLLAGVPVAVKDNLCTAGMRTTCGSRMLSQFVPSYDAEAVRRLKAAGAVLIGKTNMDEFAMGSTTETSAFGAVKNPWNTKHVPGGSSGGSCAAAASGEVCCALGSDTGGSVRQPAAFCGVTGLKPTYGTVSRYGLVAYASSLDQVGTIGRDISDCAALLEIIAGQDAKDSTTVKRTDCDFTAALQTDIRGLRIGIPAEYFGDGLDDEVRLAVLQAADVLRQQGAVVEEFSLPLTQYAVPAYYLIACAEASSNLARFDGVKYGYRAADCTDLHELYRKSRSEGFGAEAKRRILLGSFVLSSGYYEEYYLKALRTKRLIAQAFAQAFQRYDVLLGPTAPRTAPLLGSSLGDPLQMYLGDTYTVAANLAGLPAVSVPCGLDQNGLPIGMQLMADHFQEKTMIKAAYAYEQACGKGRDAYGCTV